jgi:putative glutamine amidotransferase
MLPLPKTRRAGPADGRPVIGVTGHAAEPAAGGRLVVAGQAYLAAVEAAGGLPVVLPPVAAPDLIAAALDRVDGVLFTGGKDIDPRHFGEAVLNATVKLEPERDAFELPLAREAVARDLPVLAICRGCQVLNVALGGSLWQDLPVQQPQGLAHAQAAPRDAPTHTVLVQTDTLLARALDLAGPPGAAATHAVDTNSFHHQAAKHVPEALAVVARAADGTIEAVEAPGRRFVLGVQWHPEHLAASRPEHRRLFEALVEAARCPR